jgi:hypothetical protein
MTDDPTKMDPADLDAARDLGLKLTQLPHDHALVIAARLALEIRADRMQSYDDYPDGRYHRTHELPGEYTELQKRRYPPNGDRDEWVRGGAVEIPGQRQPAEWTPAPAGDAGAARVRGS